MSNIFNYSNRKIIQHFLFSIVVKHQQIKIWKSCNQANIFGIFFDDKHRKFMGIFGAKNIEEVWSLRFFNDAS